MSAYLMKQGMPATAGRKADRFIYAGSVGTVVLLVAGKEYPIGMYLTVFLLTLCGFICVALGTEAYAFAFGVPAVCYGGLSFLEVFIASWAVLMQGTSQNPSKMWKLDMLPKTVSCLIAGVIFLGYVCFICKKKTIKRIAEEYKGLIVTFGAGLHIVILIYQLMLMGEGTKWYFQNIVTANVIALLLIWLLWQFSKFIFRYESLQRENQMIEFQNTMMENNYANLKEALEENRRINHDMKNHLGELALMAGNQNNEEIRKYIQDMGEYMQNQSELVSCGNKNLDSLLNYLLGQAKKKLNHVEYEVRVPSDLCISAFDLNVILGNLTENAIEAAEQTKDKWMSVDIYYEKGMLSMEIKNSFQHELAVEKNKLLSTKEEKGHGIGLANVRKMVEKYQGFMDVSNTNQIFIVKVMLYL